MNKSVLLAAAVLQCAAMSGLAEETAAESRPQTLKVSADVMAADNVTGTLVASGHVRAVSHPICLLSELASKRGDVYEFADPTTLTTCTNDEHSLHWSATGGMTYRDQKSVVIKDVVVRAWGVPVMWLPYWYYPLDTDYGLRVMPGYTSRWGAFLMTKYVYDVIGGHGDGDWGLGGSTRLDLRNKNGVALGQTARWYLGEYGRGKFSVYYAWDEDADRYDKRWTSRHYRYDHWNSKVPDERYGMTLEHMWLPTERDIVRLRGAYYSDTEFRNDFMRNGLFGTRNHMLGSEGNEAAWEHIENSASAGLSVSGPLNKFYGGVTRLPEVYFDIMPRPLFGLPVNYESESSAAFLNRDYARLGYRRTASEFRYAPGRWADYQTFRFDTYHRFSAPFKVEDVLSVVPRIGLRGTYWNHTGRENLTGYGRAGRGEDDVTRLIVEGGATFAARGTKWLDDKWRHVFEPYMDVLAQEAEYYGLKGWSRPYVFDSVDSSRDWLDQYAGRSRNLPYSWYGFTPGLRNVWQRAEESGRVRTFFDLDFYAAVQLNKAEWTRGGKYHRLSRHADDPLYGKRDANVMPGVRARLFPTDGTSLGVRAEYDSDSSRLAYADVSWMQKVSKDLHYTLSYNQRDHRMWDFSSSPYNPDEQKNDDFNWAHFSYLELTAEHELCDAVAWGPFVRWDCRRGELDEAGSWIDLRTDCLGFRFSVSYENDYERVDRSKTSDDWRFGFYVYLRALGASSGSIF